MLAYLDAKLRSFGRFLLTFLQTLKFTRRLAAGLGYFGAYLQRLLFFPETFPFLFLYLHEIDHVPLAYIYVCVFPLDFVLNRSVGLKC